MEREFLSRSVRQSGRSACDAFDSCSLSLSRFLFFSVGAANDTSLLPSVDFTTFGFTQLLHTSGIGILLVYLVQLILQKRSKQKKFSIAKQFATVLYKIISFAWLHMKKNVQFRRTEKFSELRFKSRLRDVDVASDWLLDKVGVTFCDCRAAKRSN
ncbi:hypothetical protein T06_4729 [Trichinella sp. T6]|nr:hypothetical protein T06_4729 [Trichinella sp. T6]